MTPFRPLTRHAVSVALWCASIVSVAQPTQHTRLVAMPAPAAAAGAASVPLWHAAARDAIARHGPNQQATLRLLAYLARAQHQAAGAMGDPPVEDDAWSAPFDRVSRLTIGRVVAPAALRSDARTAQLADALPHLRQGQS